MVVLCLCLWGSFSRGGGGGGGGGSASHTPNISFLPDKPSQLSFDFYLCVCRVGGGGGGEDMS